MLVTLRKVLQIALPVSVVLLLLQVCSSGYDIDVAPPTGKETYAEVMPASVGGQAVEVQPLLLDERRYHGARGRYGNRASVEIIEVRSLGDLDSYVNEHIKPRLDGYPDRVSGKFNGVWSLRGRSKTGRFHGWQNHHWLFVIEASDEAAFEEAISRFRFVRRR